MSAADRISVVERIKADHRGAEVLSFLLGTKINPDKTTAIRCLRPGMHKNGDKHPSCIAKPDACRLDCPCGLSLGLFDLVVEKGLASDAAKAAEWLEHQFYPSLDSGTAEPPEVWPWFPKTAAGLGWKVTEEGGVPCIVAPTFDADGVPQKTKTRFQKDMGKDTGRFSGTGIVGLLGADQALAAIETIENPRIAILCGETDLLAWTWHAKSEGIAIPGVSHSAGEGSSWKEFLRLFRGVDVLYVADNDDAGRKGAEKARLEIGEVAKSFTTLFPPAGKDTCDYLRAGGTVRKILAGAEEAPTEATPEEVRVWDLAEALTRDPPDPPEELVEGLLARPSVNIVFGPPSSGKSWAVMHLCLLALYGAGNFLGNPDSPVFPARGTDGASTDKVLWIFGSEDTQRRIELRLRKILRAQPIAGWNPPPGAFVYATPPLEIQIGTKDGDAWVNSLIEAHHPTILVLDTIASLCGDAVDPMKTEDVVPFMKRLHNIRDRHQLTTFGLHHTRKQAPDAKKSSAAKADSMLGTQAWRSMADACLMLDAQDGDTEDVTVRLVKSKDIDRPTKPFHTAFRDGEWHFLRYDTEEDPSKPKKVVKGSPEHILTLRESFPDGLPLVALHKKLGCAKGTWSEKKAETLRALLKDGHVVVADTLKWASEPGTKF